MGRERVVMVSECLWSSGKGRSVGELEGKVLEVVAVGWEWGGARGLRGRTWVWGGWGVG